MSCDINQLKAEILLLPFKATIGSHLWERVCHDTDCYLGRKAKDVQIKQGGWRPGNKGRLESKAGYRIQLDLNNGMTGMVMCALGLQNIALGGSTKDYNMVIESSLPVDVETWFQRTYRDGRDLNGTIWELEKATIPEETANPK